MHKENDVTILNPRKKPDVKCILKEIRSALDDGQASEFFTRMEHNHDTRHCWWPGQTNDGRKWPAGRKLMPGQRKDDVFPWQGASDCRVPVVEEIIAERVIFKATALDRGQQRVAPRNLATEDDPTNKAILWGQTADYFLDEFAYVIRTAAKQWADIAEEYGHAVLYVGWKTEKQVSQRTITAEQVLAVATDAALQLAQMALAEAAQLAGQEPEELTPEEKQAVIADAAARFEMMVADESQREKLIAGLMAFDDEMPRAEAVRVAKGLKLGGPVTYYAVEEVNQGPDWRALTPYLDVLYPPTTTRIQNARWVAMPEWVSDVELRAREETEGYDKAWVDQVLEHAGMSFELSEARAGRNVPSWITTGGRIRSGVSDDDAKNNEQRLFQIIHFYQRATALGGVPALYHTVVHGKVEDSFGKHECCEHTHGRYPFLDHVREVTALMLLESRGVGEISFTHQSEVKVQRDMRSDFASLTIKPPLKVPVLNGQSGGSMDIRPGVQIPFATSAGMQADFMRLPGDAKTSLEIEETTIRGINGYWGRGEHVDPEVKLATRQQLVNDFLMDLREARKMTFQLIQQFAPDEIKASAIGGLPVSLNATRDEIQGQVSINVEFDAADLDLELVGKKMEFLTQLRQFDTEGLIPVAQILKAGMSMAMPAWARLLVADPQKHAREEMQEEMDVLNSLLNGIERDYVPGKNHALRRQVLLNAIGRPGEDGQPTRIQKLMMENPDVKALVENRIKFHTFQVQQMTVNPAVGRLGVEAVQGGAV